MKKTTKQVSLPFSAYVFLLCFLFPLARRKRSQKVIASLDTAEKYDIMNMIMSQEPNALSHGKAFLITAAVRPLLMSLTPWLLSCRDSLK